MKIKPALFLFLIIATIENFSTEVMLPSFPAIQKAFHVSPSDVELTLTLFLLGFASSPLLLGPIADNFGRRKILLSMMAAFTLSAFAQYLAPNIGIIQVARFVQGFASGGFFVVNQAMIRESVDRNRLPQITSWVAISWAIMSLVSPLLGGYIQTGFNWRVNFLFVAFYVGCIYLLMYYLLPETLPSQEKKHSFQGIKRDVRYLLSQDIFILSALLASLTYALLFIFYTVSPFLFQDYLGISVVKYAWLLFCAGLSYLVGTTLNRYVCRFSFAYQRVQWGLMGVTLSVILFSLSITFFDKGVLYIALPLMMMMFFSGFVFPNTLAIAMCVQESRFATASAMYCTIQFIGCSLASYLATRFLNGHVIAIAIIMMFIVSSFPVIYRSAKRTLILDKENVW